MMEDRLNIKKSLRLAPPEARNDYTHGSDADVAEIKRQLVWMSSNLLTYPFKSKDEVDYHEIVKWVAGKYGVDSESATTTTYELEKRIVERVFVRSWDQLTPSQRTELLMRIDTGGSISDKAGTALLSGSRVLGIMARLQGFKFYTLMSETICGVGSAVGITVPWAVYQGASRVVGFLSGPVGWTLTSLGMLGMEGKADEAKTAAAVIQIYIIKTRLLEESSLYLGQSTLRK